MARMFLCARGFLACASGGRLMQIRDFQHCIEIVTVLEDGGMTKRPDIKIKCEIAWDTHEFSLVQEILDEYPGIYEEALRNIDEISTWEEIEPFRPYPDKDEAAKITGELHLGYANGHYVGLNPMDFTRGVFICGETGSGKTYPVLRLCDQILSIPKKIRK